MEIIEDKLIRVTNEDIKNGTFIIPDNITIIGVRAFFKCTNLEYIDIPDGVVEVEKYAFWECENLKKVTIHNSVKHIGNSCFSGCKALEEVTLPESISKISHDLFFASGITNITIPKNVTVIEKDAFILCKNLKKVEFLGNIKMIEAGAFFACENLEEIVIPESILKVGDLSFCGNYNTNKIINTSLFISNFKSLLEHCFTIYGKKNLYSSDEIKMTKNIENLRKKELLDRIKKKLKLNGINDTNCYKWIEHKDIINKIVNKLQASLTDKNVDKYSSSYKEIFLRDIYDYREDLNPYLEEYIKEHKNEITLFKDVNIDDVLNKINNFEIKQLESDISLSSYGNELNYVPMFIADTFEKLQFRFTKEFRVLKINEEFKKMQNKRNFLLEKLFLQANNDEIMLNKKVIMDLCIFINEEIGKCENYKGTLSKLRELVNTYVSKMNEHLTKIENFEKEENRLIIKDKIDSMMKSFIVMREFLNTIDLEIETASHYSIKLGDVIKVHIPLLLLQVTRHRIKKNAENLSIINDISNILDMLSNEYNKSIEMEENNNVKKLYKLN